MNTSTNSPNTAMAASPEAITQAADALHQARQTRTPIERISEQFGIHSLQDAYAVARHNTQRALTEGRRIAGCKVGLTSRAVQQQLGVDQPDYGVLFTDMELLDGDTLALDRLIQPKAEGEIAFVMGRDANGEHLSWGQFLHCVEYALPALEIVDSAIRDWRITLVDTVADNASCGLYVLGTQPRALTALDWASAGMELRAGAHTVSVGSGAACMQHPLRAAYWLAHTMAALGQPLKAGDVVLSGALGPMTPLQAGQHLDLDICGLGRVRCYLE